MLIMEIGLALTWLRKHHNKTKVYGKIYGFENWLKANNYVSWKSYLSFLKQIEKDL